MPGPTFHVPRGEGRVGDLHGEVEDLYNRGTGMCDIHPVGHLTKNPSPWAIGQTNLLLKILGIVVAR